MNERHPSGYTPDYDAYAYDVYSTGAYQAVGTAFADDATTGTYGYIPAQTGQYGYDPTQAQPQAQTEDYVYGTGYSYDYGQQTGGYDQPQGQTQTAQGQGYETGYDPYSYAPGATYYDTGTYDAQQFASYQQPQAYPQQDWDSGAYPTYGYGYDASGDTGIYEQVPSPYQEQGQAQAQAQAPGQEAQDPHPYEAYQAESYTAEAYRAEAYAADAYRAEPYEAPYEPERHEAEPVAESASVPGAEDVAAERHDYAADGFEPGAARSRRRKPAKRSALLTVAVPSVAVMGVAAVGAGAVTGVGVAQDSNSAQADGAVTGKAPTTQLDRQLAGVSQDANDFADRASRTQERIDLKDRQAAAKKAADAAAARKEALRPKFVLPVKQRGLSAYFGQAGVNWMALHTGIDFPVMVGTPVMAVTDGTVRTQWNSSYGNMAIVTAPDGTETWYCHLSSTKIRSGSVKAGTVIAYSGNTGNTTGPHLHLEVRPGGGSPIDPLPWLLKHGLDPR